MVAVNTGDSTEYEAWLRSWLVDLDGDGNLDGFTASGWTKYHLDGTPTESGKTKQKRSTTSKQAQAKQDKNRMFLLQTPPPPFSLSNGVSKDTGPLEA